MLHFYEEMLRYTPLSEESVEIFTKGDCWALARVLHELGAGELVMLVSEPAPSVEWSHILIRRPNGKYLDAYGLLTEKEMRLFWDWTLYREDSQVVPIHSLEHFEKLTASEKPFSSHEEIAEAANLLYRRFCL